MCNPCSYPGISPCHSAGSDPEVLSYFIPSSLRILSMVRVRSLSGFLSSAYTEFCETLIRGVSSSEASPTAFSHISDTLVA
ncbi:hypothetical protein QUF72_06330 [Desulfobacterales bacterium HSG2]|nr:hypothetical protein [Desulfobacterales bacterium HSG2]